MWQTKDLKKYMDDAIGADDDAFAIVKKQGKWFGSAWYKYFDEREGCNTQGQLELNRLSKTGPGWNDFYIRKSRIACDASVDEAAICCANSADNSNDPFLQACSSEAYEQTTYQFIDRAVCRRETKTITQYDNQYHTQTISEGRVDTVDNSVCCQAYDRDGDINNSKELLWACEEWEIEDSIETDYEFRDDQCYLKTIYRRFIDRNINNEHD